jgi:UDP-N-acetylglucosamine:LPS N-acetylglucosamine transferase
MLLSDAFVGHDVRYATTIAGLAERSGISNAALVTDCNRNEPVRALRCALGLFRLTLRHRPDVVISTGALPGVMALAIGRLLGARTIWVDSIANAEEFSMAGKLSRRYADLWLSQWPHVAEAAGARWEGSVL